MLRAACDCIAAQRLLLAEGFAEYHAWLEGALSQDRERAAMAFDLGRFRAGSALAEDEQLGSVYRLLTDLSMPHFGSTALETAPDSSLQKLGLAFADRAFHLGWAELVLAWLLTLAGAQLETSAGCGVFSISDETRAAYGPLDRDIRAAVSNPRRCHAEELAGGRYLLHNFRRAASGTPKRVVL